jgi:hypothetical protein
MPLTPIQQVIPETRVVVFAPHYDDFLLGLGGYVLELKARDLFSTKRFHILLLFSRSNYQAGSGPANFDSSLDRIKLATGRRLLEDLECLDELLGPHLYRYELLGERESFVRGKAMADSEMEFPHGMYPDFTPEDSEIFTRLQALVRRWAGQEDTALVFPLAIKEHIDHFLAREAAITTARDLGSRAKARFYFAEDKPYAGIQTPEEAARIASWVEQNGLIPRLYPTHPAAVVDLAFKHYTSQVEEVYRQGVLERALALQDQYGFAVPAEQLFVLPRS